jgi:hypothetical protein
MRSIGALGGLPVSQEGIAQRGAPISARLALRLSADLGGSVLSTGDAERMHGAPVHGVELLIRPLRMTPGCIHSLDEGVAVLSGAFQHGLQRGRPRSRVRIIGGNHPHPGTGR